MEYGLITYKETENIGDDIQSYVAMRFLPEINYYIEREKLDLFLPKEKKQIITIMNGWYLHSKINFPISPYIHPIYISTHFSAYTSGGIKTEYLNEYSTKELNKYGPIGCRDSSTLNLLEKKGIDSYFSGCMTLTIKADENIKKENYICLVDIEANAEKYICENLGDSKTIIKRTHTLNKDENSKLSWEQRFKNVKELLDTYQASDLVITSRLHCALPCLALGTKVILLYDENKEYTKDRLSDYAKILIHMSTNEFLENGINIINNGIENPSDYKKIRQNIEKNLEELIKNANPIKCNELPELKEYKKLYIEPKKNIDYLYQIAVSDMDIRKQDYINLNYEKEYWQNEFNILLSKYNPTDANWTKFELKNLLGKYEEILKENMYLKEKLEICKKRKLDKK